MVETRSTVTITYIHTYVHIYTVLSNSGVSDFKIKKCLCQRNLTTVVLVRTYVPNDATVVFHVYYTFYIFYQRQKFKFFLDWISRNFLFVKEKKRNFSILVNPFHSLFIVFLRYKIHSELKTVTYNQSNNIFWNILPTNYVRM